MINIKEIVKAALENDAALVKLLNGKHIYRQYPQQSADFSTHSLIVYSAAEEPYAFGDETELVTKVRINLDVLSLKSTTEIAQAVNRIVTGLGGVRVEATDNDQDAPKQCKSMAFEFTVDNEGNIY